MTPGREWTATELLAEAEHRGLPLSRRQITDWIEKGLIDKPRRRGTGRGSKPAVWSDHQAKMALAVLDKQSEAGRIWRLADLPVGAFLGWGEDFASITQVRRAMRTWAGAHSGTPLARTRHSVNLLLEDFSPNQRQPKLRAALTDLLVSANTPATFAANRDQIEAALRTAVGSTGPALSIPKIDSYLNGVEARLTGMTPFAEATDQAKFPDATIRLARSLYEQSRSGYAAESGLSEGAIVQELFDGACRTLALLLGYSLLSQHPDWTQQ